MNAIAISLYDKFDDLSALVDIIRDNWTDDYFISVCSNHPDADEKIGDLESRIDHFEKGSQITYRDSSPGHRIGNNLSYRIFDSIRRSCNGAFTAEGVEYVMHLHADAWPLDEQTFKDLTDELSDKEAYVAFPSSTSKFLSEYPPGRFEDNFLIFDANAANSAGLFEKGVLEFPPTWIHQILPMICISKFGWGNLYQFTNQANREHWDGKPISEVDNHARPMFYDRKFCHVHIAKEDFGEDLGKSLQAYYLAKHGLTEGDYISQLIRNHGKSEEQLFFELQQYIDEFDRQLRWYGLSVNHFGRDFRNVESFLEELDTKQQVKTLVETKFRNTTIFPLIKGTYESIQKITNSDDHGPQNELCINDVFQRELNEDDFPAEVTDDYRSSFLE